MPTLEATCSLDVGCPESEFRAFCDSHPDREVIVYANTSYSKARADWVVTSSIAVEVISALAMDGKKLIWAPDRYLGRYVQSSTGADMLIWDSVVSYEEFRLHDLDALQWRIRMLVCWCIQNRLKK